MVGKDLIAQQTQAMYEVAPVWKKNGLDKPLLADRSYIAKKRNSLKQNNEQMESPEEDQSLVD